MVEHHALNFGTWLSFSVLTDPESRIDCGAFPVDIPIPISKGQPGIRQIRKLIDPRKITV
jgi:hypothetical protein